MRPAAARPRINDPLMQAALAAYRGRQVDRASALKALVEDAGCAHTAADRMLAALDMGAAEGGAA